MGISSHPLAITQEHDHRSLPIVLRPSLTYLVRAMYLKSALVNSVINGKAAEVQQLQSAHQMCALKVQYSIHEELVHQPSTPLTSLTVKGFFPPWMSVWGITATGLYRRDNSVGLYMRDSSRCGLYMRDSSRCGLYMRDSSRCGFIHEG